jgi:hypothetical protein
MKREEATKNIKYIQAYANGEDIEYYNTILGEWRLASDPTFAVDILYRIKPVSKYRPFKEAKECWNEMQKHKLFGWVIEKEHNEHFNINSIGETGVGGYTYREAFEELVFADGTPFGIKEE